MCGGLTRLGQRVAGIVVLLKELEDGSGFVKGILSLPSSNSGLPSIDTDLNPHHTIHTTHTLHSLIMQIFVSLKIIVRNHGIFVVLN